ncbi:MAG: hypothetical protein AABY22_18065 [Nanoarchaeota archaeon]
MEDNKKKYVLVFLSEDNKEIAVSISKEDLIVNDFWVKYRSRDNWISIPTNRVIKIKEEVKE